MIAKDRIKIVICDLDDTTLPPGQSRFSDRLVTAIKGCRKNGIRFMLNTGRHYRFIPKAVLKQLPPGVIGTINGACLVGENGETYRKHPMREENMWRLVRAAWEHGLGLGFKFEDTVVSYANHDVFVAGYCHGDAAISALTKDDSKLQHHHLQYGLPLGTFLVGSKDIVEPLAQEFPELVFARSSWVGYDVFQKNITKATAAEDALKIYGLTWENVLAFGDAGNDVPLLEKAASGYTMANAPEDVRRQARQIAPACVDDGVAQVLEEMELC